MLQQGQVPELTIPELLDQPWTKRAARIASFIAMLFFGAATTYFFSLGNRVTAIEQDRATRIVRVDQNTTTLNEQVSGLGSDIDRIRLDVTALKVDLAEVKGILKQIRQEQVAAMDSSPPSLAPMPFLTGIARSN